MEMATKLGYTIVDRMLGGEGEPLEKIREFSEIELLIIERVMNSCVELLREPWENVLDCHPRLERIETNPQFAQIISPAEMISIVTINIKIGEVEGLMNVCLPYITLEPVMDKLNTKFWYSNMNEKRDSSYAGDIEYLISKVNVPIRVILGQSSVSVADFATLRVGDVVRLDSKVNSKLDVFVGDIRKFSALPGAAGKNYAVRITDIIREEEQVEDE
jgi:flagellar motor switch protein FliM